MDTATIITVVGGLLGYLADRFLSRKKADKRAAWKDAIETAAHLAASLAYTFGEDRTVGEFQTAVRGLIAVQLARVGVDADNPPLLVSTARELAVAEATRLFVSIHPQPRTLRVPVPEI